MLFSRSLLFSTASLALTASITLLAVLTPATEANKKPMALLLVGTFFVASPALLMASARADDR